LARGLSLRASHAHFQRRGKTGEDDRQNRK
jgi:hypothetical protein